MGQRRLQLNKLPPQMVEAFEGLRPISANLFRMFFVKLPQNRHPSAPRHQVLCHAMNLCGAPLRMTILWRVGDAKTSIFSDFYWLLNKLALMGLRRVFFNPCTLHGKPGQVVRTWRTRPER